MGARKGGSHTGNDSQYIATQQNLDKKGKTNKKWETRPQKGNQNENRQIFKNVNSY